MKNIKTTFDSFLNEELSPSTYASAAKKLSDRGHKKRGEKIKEFGEEITKKEIEKKTEKNDEYVSKIQPITITIGGDEYIIKPEYINCIIIPGEGESENIGNIEFNWEIPSDLLPEDEEYIGQSISFVYNEELNEILDGPIIDGVLIDNRKSAVKLIKLLKDLINIKVDIQPELELTLPYLKINDFYQD